MYIYIYTHTYIYMYTSLYMYIYVCVRQAAPPDRRPAFGAPHLGVKSHLCGQIAGQDSASPLPVSERVAPLRRRMQVGRQAFGAPDQGVNRSLCCQIAYTVARLTV